MPARSKLIPLFAFVILAFMIVKNTAAQEPPPSKDGPKAAGEEMDVEFSHKGGMRMLLKEEILELETPYGVLKIPTKDVLRIDLATRLGDEDTKTIAASIANLSSTEFAVREAAMHSLAALAERAYPVLLKAAKDADPEVIKRAQALASQLETSLPAERLAY